MLFFVFIILAGYLSVKCDDASNYYVVEMPTDVTTVRSQKPFNVYWNVPTKQCKSKKIPFNDLYERYGIIQNANDSFLGEKVAILYDPGLFPALLTNETSGKFKFRNGGVPQEGNITSHLDVFRSTVETSIPDEKFDGIGIIDFESWRPVFRQNFGVLVPYKDVSVEIEKKLHWWWPKTWLQEEAKDRFEAAARLFMQSTVSFAKQLRPRALWGYYGFPYCFNVATNNPGEACPANVVRENNQIKWLWSESTALYPSIYSSVNLTRTQLTWLVRGRVSEAARVRGGGAPILPYFWYRYRDAGFLTKQDLDTVLKALYNSEASGFIIWGSSNDVNTVTKCNKLQEYVNNTLGPAIAKYVKYSVRLIDETTTIVSNATESGTISPINLNNDTIYVHNPVNETNQSITTVKNSNKTINIILDNVEIQIDPYKTVPQEYEGNIVQEVEDELNNKSEYMISEIIDDIKDINNKDKHDLIEIFMNLMNSKNKTDFKAKDNSTVYTLVPFLAYFSISNNTEVNKNNSVDFNNETPIPIVNDFTTETSVTYKDNDYNEVNTILYELNNLVETKQTSDSEDYINTEQTILEINTELEIQPNRLNNDNYKGTYNSESYTNTEQTTPESELDTQQNTLNNNVSETETSESESLTNTEQTTQEIETELDTEQNTLNNNVSKTETSESESLTSTEQTMQEIETELDTKHNTLNNDVSKTETSESESLTNTEQTTQEIETELDSEPNTLNNDVSKTETSESESLTSTEQTTQEIETELDTEQNTLNSETTEYFSTTETYSATALNSTESIFDTTKYTESTTDDDNIEMFTETEKSKTTGTTEKLDEYDTTVTNIDISTELPTSSNLEETRNVNNSTDFENLLENTTSEPNIDFYDGITELIGGLENKVSQTTNNEEYNYTAYSLPSSIPDKVVVYIL